jgi:hypothetical protein
MRSKLLGLCVAIAALCIGTVTTGVRGLAPLRCGRPQRWHPSVLAGLRELS